MSATVDTSRLLKYFEGKQPLEVVDVSGRMFPVTQYFLEDVLESLGLASDPVKAPAKLKTSSSMPTGVWSRTNGNAEHVMPLVQQIDDRYIPLGVLTEILRKQVKKPCPGAALVFLPGRGEIAAAKRWLDEDVELRCSCFIVELHGTAGSQAKRDAFAPGPHGKMKVVLSTNVAETSLTIPDIDCVVDSGLIRISDELVGALRTVWAGISNTKQRAGRAGRVRPGEYYALFTKVRREKLEQEILPEIMRRHLTRLCLLVHEMGLKPKWVLQRTLDPPADKQIDRACQELRDLGGVNKDEKITNLGRLLGALPSEPRLGLTMVASALLGLHKPMARVIATLSVQESASTGKESPEVPVNEITGTSDLFPKAQILIEFEDCWCDKQKRAFCEQKGMSFHMMQMMETSAQQLEDPLNRIGKDQIKDSYWSGESKSLSERLEDEWSKLSWLLALGLGHQIALQVGIGKLRTRWGAGKVARDSLWSKRECRFDYEDQTIPPDVLLYASLVPVQGPTICQVLTAIPLLAALLFSLRMDWYNDRGHISKWLRIHAPFEDLALIGALSAQFADVLEEISRRWYQQSWRGDSGGRESEEIISEENLDLWRTTLLQLPESVADINTEHYRERLEQMRNDDAGLMETASKQNFASNGHFGLSQPSLRSTVPAHSEASISSALRNGTDGIQWTDDEDDDDLADEDEDAIFAQFVPSSRPGVAHSSNILDGGSDSGSQGKVTRTPVVRRYRRTETIPNSSGTTTEAATTSGLGSSLAYVPPSAEQAQTAVMTANSGMGLSVAHTLPSGEQAETETPGNGGGLAQQRLLDLSIRSLAGPGVVDSGFSSQLHSQDLLPSLLGQSIHSSTMHHHGSTDAVLNNTAICTQVSTGNYGSSSLGSAELSCNTNSSLITPDMWAQLSQLGLSVAQGQIGSAELASTLGQNQGHLNSGQSSSMWFQDNSSFAVAGATPKAGQMPSHAILPLEPATGGSIMPWPWPGS
eukprot:gnl/MRDRNA2_/MRDRNA2_31403_c0_seq1.p1 gnl/MRDRNA2_/MRDRNA2_31403_c0~~gnl/MRDRNA2_/MRDRNA2_31403_c0_seq1.p1  ORF type:complete len:1032 (+),score=180.09 gnl/MRDRNA2_/MRDRNA2_31403_c0_seq1:139-3096(+)